MSVNTVRAYLSAYGLEDRVMEFNVSSATVELAAKALGTEPARIAKSLCFHLGDSYALVVVAGDARIQNAKFKAAFQVKARMASPEDTLRVTGHAVGGVCPFALPQDAPVRTYLDVSLRRFDRVYPACGSSSSAIGLTCDELYAASGAEGWVDVSALPNPA